MRMILDREESEWKSVEKNGKLSALSNDLS